MDRDRVDGSGRKRRIQSSRLETPTADEDDMSVEEVIPETGRVKHEENDDSDSVSEDVGLFGSPGWFGNSL
jgi:hypothetical protein